MRDVSSSRLISNTRHTTNCCTFLGVCDIVTYTLPLLHRAGYRSRVCDKNPLLSLAAAGCTTAWLRRPPAESITDSQQFTCSHTPPVWIWSVHSCQYPQMQSQLHQQQQLPLKQRKGTALPLLQSPCCLCLVATALSATTSLLELAACGAHIWLCAAVWHTRGGAKVLHSLAAVLGSPQQHTVLACGALQGQLVKGEALTTSLVRAAISATTTARQHRSSQSDMSTASPTTSSGLLGSMCLLFRPSPTDVHGTDAPAADTWCELPWSTPSHLPLQKIVCCFK